MLTPVDLETTVFRRGWRGYNIAEVREFMNQVIHDYESLYRDNINLKEQIEELTGKLGHYQLMEESLRNAVILAQRTAEELKTSAQVQAEALLHDAEMHGQKVRSQVRNDIQVELHNLATLKNQAEFFKSQFKNFLQSLLELAEQQMNLNVAWDQIQDKLPPFGAAQPEMVAGDSVNPLDHQFEATTPATSTAPLPVQGPNVGASPEPPVEPAPPANERPAVNPAAPEQEELKFPY